MSSKSKRQPPPRTSGTGSLILFPGWRAEKPTEPWLYRLCSGCGKLDRSAVGEAKPESDRHRLCGCTPADPRFAVIAIMHVEEKLVWEQLTAAKVPDHVIGRV